MDGSGTGSNDHVLDQVLQLAMVHEDSFTTAIGTVQKEPQEIVLPQASPRRKMKIGLKKKLTPKKLQIAVANTTSLGLPQQEETEYVMCACINVLLMM